MHTLSQLKGGIVKRLFVGTADENYIAARWCAANGLYNDFYWLAVHCLEKYLKAVLLLNGRAVKIQAHKITDLFSEVKNVAGKLVINQFIRPEPLKDQTWTGAPHDFICQLYDCGNPDSRYAIYPFYTVGNEVYKLDQMVFSIRRLVCQLDDLAKSKLEENVKYYGDFGLPLDRVVNSEELSDRRHAALNFNFPFAPANYAHTEFGNSSIAVNAVLDWGLIAQIESSDLSSAKIAVEAADWLLANVRIPKDVTGFICDAKQAAQKLHSF